MGVLVGGVGWAILYFGFVRRRNPRAGLRHFLVLTGIAFGAHMLVELTPVIGALTHDRSQEALAQQGVIDSFNKLRSGSGPVDSRPLANGEAGVVERFVRENLNKTAALQQSCEDELRKTGLPVLFSEQGLGADPGLTGADAKLRDVGDIYRKCQRLLAARQDQIVVDAQALQISEARRSALLGGIAKVRPGVLAQLRENANDDDAMLAEYQAALQVLKSARGRWGFNNGKLAFTQANDLNAFNGHLAKVETIVADSKARFARRNADNLKGFSPVSNP